MSQMASLRNLVVYSVSHALVDATCAAALFAIVALGQTETRDLFYLIVLYNVMAFATQPLWGLGVDIFKASKQSAVLGMLLVAASTLFLKFPFPVAVMAGLGNALFHVGGGAAILNLASGKAARPGLFVAPGALGLTIGIVLGKSGHFVAWPFVLLLMGSALLTLKMPQPKTAAPRPSSGNLKWFEPVILLLLISIAIRSLVGLSLVFPWKSNPALLFALTGAVLLGKAGGGILGDRFGWTTVAVAGLAVSAPLLTFWPQVPTLAILGTFLFNLSTPITLTCLARMLPGKSGFAFGLTALALLIGAWPILTQPLGFTSDPRFILVTILISSVAVYGGVRLYFRHFGDHLPIQSHPSQSGEEA
jgi:MFS transporter, FSR family, fosmidomycin resistance protein